jgi:hypothetical protein
MKTSERRSRLRLLWIGVMTIACWGMLFAQQVTVTIPASSLLPGTSVKIPVNVGSTTGANITAFEFVITCDTTIMTLDGVDATGAITAGSWSLLANNFAGGFSAGRMKVVAASSSPLTGSGVLVYINGTTKNKAGSSPLTFASFIFNTGATSDPQPTITPGTVRVNRPPTISPESAKTVAQGDSLFFTPVATDLDLPNDTLKYSLPNAPAGAKINATTGAFGWRPNFTQVGPFAVVLKVTDTGGMSDSTIVSITVSKTNVKPTFVNKMRDTTINQGATLNFTYSATDQNGDPLSFFLLTPPTGATMTTAGVFKWRPVYPLTGAITITAMVSDGILQDVATATVTVARVNQKPTINSRVPVNAPTISANKPVTFAVSASDPNGDPLTYRWTVNNQTVKTGTDSSYTVTFTDPHNTAKIVTGVAIDPEGLADSTLWVFTITDVQNEKGPLPTDYVLGQNYPNPFNPTTTIQFDLPKVSAVTLEVFNISGARVRSLLKGENLGAGSHTMMWDGRDQSGRLVPSGTYMYRITAGDFHAWKKMTLLK